MSRDTKRRLAVLREVYRKVPTVHCKGLCAAACGPIVMSTLEFDHLTQLTGAPPTFSPEGKCSLLVGNRCSVYRDRPLICRIWGASEADMMTCPHGCAPAQPLSDGEGRALLRAAEEIGGPPKADPDLLAFMRKRMGDATPDP